MTFLHYRSTVNYWLDVRRIALCRRLNVSSLRRYAPTLAERPRDRDTAPSSSRPSPSNVTQLSSADQGHLSFTKASLYKLILPLIAPIGDSNSPASAAAVENLAADKSASVSSSVPSNGDERAQGPKIPWEQEVESGNKLVSQLQRNDTDDMDYKGSDVPVRSVIFLLHPGQPLSYIANLIRAENPEYDLEATDDRRVFNREHKGHSDPAADPTGSPPITFHTWPRDGKRWSPSTGIGDFLREAARIGSFIIRLGSRTVAVNVPNFEDRTRFLRASLHAKTAEIERLAKVKDECDREARRSTQRVAFAGAGILGVWWVTVSVLTFHTPLGWDTMEPITYLTGLGTVIGGYLWFLWHNREANYRAVLTETTSRRQSKLYIERGFDVERYHELIEEDKDLRKAIKRVAWDYELTWDQGDTEAGKRATRALEIIRSEEEKERKGRAKHHDDDDREEDQDDELVQAVDETDDRKNR